MAKFDKNKLKNVETVEKNVLPTADDIKDAKEAEKSHWNLYFVPSAPIPLQTLNSNKIIQTFWLVSCFKEQEWLWKCENWLLGMIHDMNLSKDWLILWHKVYMTFKNFTFIFKTPD